MNRLYLSEQIKRSEAIAAKNVGISLFELMQRAGSAAFERLLTLITAPAKILICCGSGNNGGDGFVLARLAHEAGFDVCLCQPTFLGSKTEDSKKARQQWIDCGGYVYSEIDLSKNYDFVVDALLGTGINSSVRENLSSLITQINELACPVMALDVPTGLHANTGAILGNAVSATITVTFIGNKLGLVTGQAKSVVGQLYVAELGVKEVFCLLETPVAHVFDQHDVGTLLPHRSNTAHKGDCGRAVLVGGDQGFSGALILASQAAARVGAGLISAITHPNTISPLLVRQPEIMAMAHSESNDCVIPEWSHKLDTADAIGLGPGLGIKEWGSCLYQAVFSKAPNTPKVIDADALNILAKQPNPLSMTNVVLTPHPGEAARLLNQTIAQIESDRFAAVNALQQKYQAVVVLKGAGTLICDGNNTWVVTAGNSGMASGGMGDVLTGIITGLLAQGLTASESARLGVWIHATAADKSVEKRGKIGLLASDLHQEIRILINGAEV